MLKILDFLYFSMNEIASRGKKRISLEDTKWSFGLLLTMFILPLEIRLSVFALKFGFYSKTLNLIVTSLVCISGFIFSFLISKKFYGINGIRIEYILKLRKKIKLNRYVYLFTILLIFFYILP